MKRFLANKVIKHIGLGIVLVSVVVFLTLMFSLLGAISCAVVSGMILGAARSGMWRSLLVSLVFPAVTLVMAHVSHALQERQNLQFSLICFGSYWIAYFLTLGIVLLERKSPHPPAQLLAAAVVPGEGEPAPPSGTGVAGDPAPLLRCASIEPTSQPSLDELLGRWSCTTIDSDGQPHTKVMEIDGESLALNITDSKGRTLSVAQGGMRLEKWGPFKTLKVLNWVTNAPAGGDERAVAAPVWVYRIQGQTLTIALNLEVSPPGPPPVMETYRRAGAA